MASKPFEAEKTEIIERMHADHDMRALSRKWFIESCKHKYSYLFTWMGRPIIQFPQDILAMQELIWNVQPELIIETGIAHGGSLIFYASMLELLNCNGHVIGIDIEIRPHNRSAIENHPMSKRITMFEGSSVDQQIAEKTAEFAQGKKPILVVLDSNHTHEHVLRELQLYSPLVTRGSYLVVFDTIVEDMPDDFFPDRPWGVGNNPKTAVREFLMGNTRFEIDPEWEKRLLITVAPGGFLKCIGD